MRKETAMRNPTQLHFRIALFAVGFALSFVPLTTFFLINAPRAPQSSSDIVLRLQITPPGQAI
jgi:hypothetical protein